MAETNVIAIVSVVTDTEQAHDNIGDASAGFVNRDNLKKHIQHHGHQGLLTAISMLSHQVWSVVQEVNAEKEAASNQDNAGS